MSLYQYASKRPHGIGQQPTQGFVSIDENAFHQGSYTNILHYDRALTTDELKSFELKKLVHESEIENIAKEVAEFLMSDAFKPQKQLQESLLNDTQHANDVVYVTIDNQLRRHIKDNHLFLLSDYHKAMRRDVFAKLKSLSQKTA